MKLAEHIDRVVRRSRAFYRKAEPGHFLINAHVPAGAPSIPPLYDFDLDRQLTEWLDHKLAAAEPAWHAKDGLDDDSIPCICPHFGIAEHSAWLGMDVHLQEVTCLPIPRIKELNDLSALKLSEQDKWFGYIKSGYDYLRTQKRDFFVLSVRGTMAPMDLAHAVRGNDLLTDFLLHPDFCHRLMRFLVDAIQWYFKHLCSWADDIVGGHVFTYGGGWMPPRTIGHLSNDAAMLCSPDVYEEFGFPYERLLVEKYDAVLYHLHNEKMGYVPRLAELPGLAMLEVAHDPKTVPPIEDLPRIFEVTGSANLMLHASSDQLRAHIDELERRNVFLQVSCCDRADAEDIVALVRDKSESL